MATKAKKNQPAAAVEAAAKTTKQAAPAADFMPTIAEGAEEAKKRERGYAQTAISLEDFSRLGGLKEHFKSAHKLTVSNAQIITAALDALAHDEHMGAFLKGLVAASSDKARQRDLKKLEALQAKLGQPTEAETAK